MTAYQGNGSSIAATTVTIANKLATATGGTETSKNTSLTASTTGWIFIKSQGSGVAQSGAGSEPTITDANNFGFMQDDNTFDGQTFATGNWTPTITLNVNLNSIVADIHCLLLKRPNGGGTYTVIGDLVKTAQTINSAKTAYAFSASSLTGPAFATGDRFCIVWLLNITTGNGSATVLTCYMSTSASTGVASDAQIVSPGFNPSQVRRLICDGYGGVFS